MFVGRNTRRLCLPLWKVRSSNTQRSRWLGYCFHMCRGSQQEWPDDKRQNVPVFPEETVTASPEFGVNRGLVCFLTPSLPLQGVTCEQLVCVCVWGGYFTDQGPQRRPRVNECTSTKISEQSCNSVQWHVSMLLIKQDLKVPVLCKTHLQYQHFLTVTCLLPVNQISGEIGPVQMKKISLSTG